MYTTRRFHSKTSESFLSIGDPYDKTKQSDSRFKSRQFQTEPPKAGQLHGHFGSFSYVPDAYQDNNGYRITQPRPNRRLGFGSLDARRRDEFTLDIRAQQYKELLDKEHFFNKKHADEREIWEEKIRMTKSAPTTLESLPKIIRPEDDTMRQFPEIFFQTQVPQNLYDIGKEQGTTPICNKCSRETFYCKHRVGNSQITARRLGPHKTSAMIVGSEVKQANKPPYGRKSHIKDFYDANHLGVGSGYSS